MRPHLTVLDQKIADDGTITYSIAAIMDAPLIAIHADILILVKPWRSHCDRLCSCWRELGCED